MTLTIVRQAQLLVWAAQIDLAMHDRHVTQAELARRMGTNRATVCAMLKGHDSKASTYIAAFHALEMVVVFQSRYSLSQQAS
jgi:lambda repressor-like predicted transcriptional regulator